MPNRILREGILTSPRIAKLGWAEEVFYRRMHSVVDDFGRYFADAGLLRAACYPRQLNKVSDSDVGKWLHACVAAALVRVYRVGDEDYVLLLDFNQQVRAKKSRFPNPPSECVADAQQIPSEQPADAHLDVSVSVSVVEDDKSPRKRVPPPDGVSDSVWTDFRKLRKAKRAPITDTAIEGIRREAQKSGLSLEAALRMCCERGWQGFKAEWMADGKQSAQPGRHTDSAEETARMLADQNKGTRGMPAEVRQFAQQIVGRKAA